MKKFEIKFLRNFPLSLSLIDDFHVRTATLEKLRFEIGLLEKTLLFLNLKRLCSP